MKSKLAMPENPGVGLKVAVLVMGSNFTVPLIGLSVL